MQALYLSTGYVTYMHTGKLKEVKNMEGKNVEGTIIKRVRPVGCIYEQCSDILPNWGDIRSRFGYKTLGETAATINTRKGGSSHE